MSWFAIELLRDDPDAPFTEDLFIGKARLNSDGTFSWLFDAVPPRGAKTCLVPISFEQAEPITPPDIDFVKPLTERERRQAKALRGRGVR